mgnify:CR=1 FL=1
MSDTRGKTQVLRKPADLLRDAARLIDSALLLLDTFSVDCPGNCRHRLFRNVDHGRAYERLADLPSRLDVEAQKLDAALKADGTPRKTAAGFTAQS